MGKKFNQWLRQMAAANIYVGDINQATSAYQGGSLPTAPSDTPTPPPPAPDPIRNTNPRKLGETDGENLKIKRKSRRRRQQLSKGTGQLRINPSSTANVGGAGQAAKSGGIQT